MNKNKISHEEKLFSIIRDTLKYSPSPDFPLGVDNMDDCVLLKISDENSMAISSDFVRGSGFTLFQLGLMDYYDAGYYLVSANLSDLAAAGAKPSGLMTVIRYATMDDDDFRQVFEGMKAAADKHETPIVGGDIGSYSSDVFAATAFGIVPTDKTLLRSQAKQGDLLCTTGTIGRAFTALLYFTKCKEAGHVLSAEEEKEILEAWKRPNARIDEGLLLSSGFSKCAQDISDGLKATVSQLSASSQVGFTLYEDQIPLHPATIRLAEMLGIPALEIACSASVDFELLFTISAASLQECKAAFAARNLFFTVIGAVNDSGNNYLQTRQGTLTELPGMPFDQRPINEIIQAVLGKNS